MAGTEIANAWIALTVKAPGIKKAVDRELGVVGASGDAAGKSIGSRLTSTLSKTMKVGAAAVGGTIAAGLGAAFVKGFQRLNQIDVAQAKLKGLGNDAESVSTIMENALASVKGTAFGLGDAATTAAQLVAAQIKPGQDLEKVLKSTANAAAASGAELSEMGSIYAKVASTGKAQNDVLQQVADRGLPIYQALAEQLGVTADEVFDLASKGKIGFGEFESAMTAAAGNVADELGNTIGGSVSNFFASLGRIGANAMSGIFPQIAPAIQNITSALAPLEESASIVGEKIGQVLAPAFQWLADALNGGIDLSGFANIASYFTPLGAALQILQPILPAIQDAFASISDVLGGALAAALPVVVPAVTDLVLVLAQLAADTVPVLLPIVTQLVTEFTNFASQVLPILVPMLESVVTAGANLASGFLPVISAIGPALGPIAVGVGTAVAAVKGWNLVQKTWLGIQGLVKGVQAAYIAATYGQVGATYAAGTAQKVLNAAFKMSPLGWIVTAITAVVGALVWFFTQTETGKKIWQEFTQFLGEAWTNIQGFFTAAWENVIQPVLGAIGDALTWLNENIVQPVAAGVQIAWEAIATAAQWLWDTILSPVFNFIGGGIQVLWSIVKLIIDLIVNYFRFWGAVAVWLYENAVKPAFDALGVVFQWIYNSIIKPVFDAIGAVFQWVWNTIIKPIIDFVVAYIKMWASIFQWLYNNIIKPVFDGIAAVFKWIWDSIIKPVIDWIREKLDVLGKAFKFAYESVIKPAWERMGDLLRSVWNWIDKKVFDPFKKGIKLIEEGFKYGAEAIGKSWDGIKKAAAKPINFVLDTVWNNGLRSFWNDVVTELGLDDMKLKKAPLVKFASGGVMPGYTPGRDVHDFYSPTAGRLQLSGGEAIMRPEFTRAVGGSAGVARLNQLARSGGLGGQAFADGGVWGSITSWAGDLWDNVQGAAAAAWKFITNPAEAVKAMIENVVNPLLAQTDGSMWSKLAGSIPRLITGGLVDWLTGAQPKGKGTAGMGWSAMWDIVHAADPSIVMTSNVRGGAKNINGGYSYHSDGRAIDLIPASMATFNLVKGLFPNASELIYTPAGNQQLQNGHPFAGWSEAVKRQHYNHVHLAMADGGVVPKLYDQGGWLPHGGFAVNQSGKPEAVLDPDESAALKRGLGNRTIVVQNVRGTTVDEIADQIAWAERRLARGGKYTGRIVI